ncbi:glycogen/starch synthase [bacterium]|nr:glycogen/starch synthase [bacterium]
MSICVPPPTHYSSPPVQPSTNLVWKGNRNRRPRILLVTPELSESNFLSRNGKQSPCVKAGGLADVSAMLLDSLSESGADVHVALPHFRSLFHHEPGGHSRRLHLCQDREFSYRRSVYDGGNESNLRAALAFQRDVIQYVMPRVRPDLIHCHDWMTGLVPAAARKMGIPTLFTLHNLHDERTSLGHIEDRGIDAARFWEHLYFHDYPGSYESARSHNGVSMLASGILAADQMNTVSRSFLGELAGGGHGAGWPVVDAVRGKLAAGRAHGITNSLPDSFSPERDPDLAGNYDASGHVSGKRANKRHLQRLLGLTEDDEAPMLFWPSRLDPVQKGCQLVSDILYQLVSDYWETGLQVVFIADGPFRHPFENIVNFHKLHRRIAVRGFNEALSRMGYAASDFTLMPSAYEPCGLSQMIGLRYGSLPIVHATGGLRDTVIPLDSGHQTGNGFPFEFYDAGGLRWAIDEAMLFYVGHAAAKEANITRIMTEAADSFPPQTMVSQYLHLYQGLLELRDDL